MKTMTLVQANATIERADSLFRRAAKAWERGNNSGNSQLLSHGENQCERFRTQAEVLLSPLGITVDYPGLYPSFMFGGHCYHTTESAVSAALESATVPIGIHQNEVAAHIITKVLLDRANLEGSK